jgi:hypothetical protein
VSETDASFWSLVVAQAHGKPAHRLSDLLAVGAPETAAWPSLATLWRTPAERDSLWADLARRQR